MTLENKIHLKRFLLVSLIPLVISLVIGNIFFSYQYHTYTQNYNDKISSITVLLEEEYPELDRNKLVSILNSDTEINENIFSEYGIDIENESLILENDRSFIKNIVIYNIIIIGSFLSLILLYLKHESNQDKEIKKIVKCI